MRIILLPLLFLVTFCLQAQPDSNPTNISLVANVELPNGEVGNDIWGYTDENGLEYAIMGGASHTYIWSLEDYENPIQRAAIEGTTTIWRDMKVWEDHIYVTTDNRQSNTNYDGLLIIDMSEAPDNITFEFQRENFDVGSGSQQLGSCHNIYIDEDGYAYLAGCNIGNGGIIILDLADKNNPTFVGAVDDRYSHDVYVKDSIMYTSDVFTGIFSMYDIRDRANPEFINGAPSSSNFTHNAWLSDDGNYLFTTDELGDAYVDAFDISDPDDIQKVDRYRPLDTEGLGVIPHNTHYLDGYLVTSWYTDGFKVIDAHKPDNLIEVASYDTWQGADGVSSPDEGFNGCWGAYPFFPSGKMLASDINSGLYVLDVDFKRAAYLEGKITNANNGQPIVNATISILESALNRENSNPAGNYKTGLAEAGTFPVQVEHPSYETALVMATLVSGEVTILDVALNQSLINIKVLEENGAPIEGAKVYLSSDNIDIMEEVTTDSEGNASAGLRANETYIFQSAKWGYKGFEIRDYFFDGGSDVVTVTLSKGFEDDFFADLGWDITSTASAGTWSRGIPNATTVSGQTINPGNDSEDDIGEFAFITGNSAGVSWTQDDIDNGFTTIQSPEMDWSNSSSYNIAFDSWYYIGGNPGVPLDDTLFVYIGNGNEELLIHRENSRSTEWTPWSFDIFNVDIPFTENMYLRVRASDEREGNIVEAGIDKFRAVDNNIIINTIDIDPDWTLTAGPNPFTDQIKIKSEDDGDSQLIITDIIGRVLTNQRFNNTEIINTNDWNSGLYFIQLRSEKKYSSVIKIVKP